LPTPREVQADLAVDDLVHLQGEFDSAYADQRCRQLFHVHPLALQGFRLLEPLADPFQIENFGHVRRDGDLGAGPDALRRFLQIPGEGRPGTPAIRADPAGDLLTVRRLKLRDEFVGEEHETAAAGDNDHRKAAHPVLRARFPAEYLRGSDRLGQVDQHGPPGGMQRGRVELCGHHDPADGGREVNQPAQVIAPALLRPAAADPH